MAWKKYCVFDVLGEPKGQPRPRAFYNKKTGRAAVYDKGTAEGWKADIASAARSLLPTSPLEGPLMLSVCFFFPRPQRLLKKKSPEGRIPHTSKPDTDNAVKAVMDCLTGIRMWTDDSLVSVIKAEKHYVAKDQRPGALIQIFTFEEE
jgi:Holliday junction resolvase RusA-like endonuclease